MVNFNFAPIIALISPSENDFQKVKSATDIVVSYLKSQSSKTGVDVDVVAGGSTAKGTFLKGNFDIDIFVRFKTDELNLSDILELMLVDFSKDNNVEIERVHGSRDYFNFEFQNLFFEIVPVKFIEHISDANNVTDMSPLHVFWVKEKLNDSLRSDIRLAKQFCKSIGVYGAESYINGVSGHVLDILIIYYNGFIPFLESVSNWKDKQVVDPENKHIDVFKSLNPSKLDSPLIVIDPIDSQRNASAAVAKDKYLRLIEMAKSFLEKPSEEFFVIPKFDLEKLTKRKQNSENLFVIEVTPQKGKKDVVITKVLKIFEYLKRHFELYDFKINLADWKIDDELCHLYFFIDNQELSEKILRQGPPISNFQAVERFKEVHVDAFEKKGYMYVNVRRDFTVALTCLRNLLTQEFIVSRALNTSLKIF